AKFDGNVPALGVAEVFKALAKGLQVFRGSGVSGSGVRRKPANLCLLRALLGQGDTGAYEKAAANKADEFPPSHGALHRTTLWDLETSTLLGACGRQLRGPLPQTTFAGPVGITFPLPLLGRADEVIE